MRVPRSRVLATPAPTRTGVVVLKMLVAAVLVGLARPAGAHGDDAGVRYRLAGLEPAVEGVTVQVVRGLTGQLLLANDTDTPVEVLDDAGRAFLRIGAEGVQADVASATWRASDRPFGLGAAATTAVSSTSRWVQLSDEAGEPFLRFDGGQVEANMASPTWHRVDGRSSSIEGEMRWVRTAPVHDDGGLPLLNVVLAMAGLVTIAALGVVRRRSAKRVARRQ